MPSIDLSRFCDNGTVIFQLAKSIDYNETSRTIRVRAHNKVTDSDQQAVLYIVVVLLFYSVGIIIGIVMYLKRERAEIEEERAYEAYLNFKSDPARMTRHFNKQQYKTRLEQIEEVQRLRNKELEKDKPRLSKKRHSHHGSFLFKFGSSRTTPTTPPTTSQKLPLLPTQPIIVIDHFDDIVAKGGEKVPGSPDSTDKLLPDRVPGSQDPDIPVLVIDTKDAMTKSKSLPVFTRGDSTRSNVVVTDL